MRGWTRDVQVSQGCHRHRDVSVDEERGRCLMSAAQIPTRPKLQIVVCDEQRDLFCVDGRCGAVERGCGTGDGGCGAVNGGHKPSALAMEKCGRRRWKQNNGPSGTCERTTLPNVSAPRCAMAIAERERSTAAVSPSCHSVPMTGRSAED
ncbi:hypothetical protein K523DRAFT_109650 [Schizophyllum commune Tattone D]|nr:hypothetical protein K523DRAFT_109650 [Schizophyllum commune Tattone D]